MNPLGAYFINLSHNLRKLTFVNASLRKKGGCTQATLSFQFRLVNMSTAHVLARSLAS